MSYPKGWKDLPELFFTKSFDHVLLFEKNRTSNVIVTEYLSIFSVQKLELLSNRPVSPDQSSTNWGESWVKTLLLEGVASCQLADCGLQVCRECDHNAISRGSRCPRAASYPVQIPSSCVKPWQSSTRRIGHLQCSQVLHVWPHIRLIPGACGANKQNGALTFSGVPLVDGASNKPWQMRSMMPEVEKMQGSKP